jgi:hypothetical protein
MIKTADGGLWLHVRFGSLADIWSANCDVRFTPKADIPGGNQHVCFGP